MQDQDDYTRGAVEQLRESEVDIAAHVEGDDVILKIGGEVAVTDKMGARTLAQEITEKVGDP
jgi:ribosomal protein S6